LFVANSIIARAELSAQMIASLNLFVINGISGSISRVAIIYIGILHCLFLLFTMAKVGKTSKRKCKFSENAFYIYVKKPIFKMSCFYNNPSGNPSRIAPVHLSREMSLLRVFDLKGSK
jgi:hypothetical protein